MKLGEMFPADIRRRALQTRLCERKVGHATLREAEATRHLMLATAKHRNYKTLHSYRCTICHQWHVGNWHGAKEGAR